MVIDVDRASAGSWQAQGTWTVHPGDRSVAVVEGGRRQPPLLCVLSVRSADEEVAVRAVLVAVTEVYTDPSPATLTTRLTQAVRAAHATLQGSAFVSGAGTRPEAALACLVQRGEQICLAHAGPVACYVLHHGHGAPERVVPTLATPATLPLGRRGEAEVTLTSLSAAPGSTVAIAVGPLAARLGDDGWTWLLESPTPGEVRERLSRLASSADVPNMTLALVAHVEDPGGGLGAGWVIPPHRTALRAPALAARERKIPAATFAPHGAATLPPQHSRTVAAGVLFASLAIAIAGVLMSWRFEERLPALAQLPALVDQALAPSQGERQDVYRTLSARGTSPGARIAAVAGAGRPEPARFETIQLGPLRELVRLPGGAVSDVALLDRALVVVDSRQGRVVKYLVDPAGPATDAQLLWQAGERRSMLVLGRPVSVAPLPAARRSAARFAVATEDGGLWMLDGSRVDALPSLPDEVVATALAAAPGRLFALARPSGELWVLSLDTENPTWRRVAQAASARDVTADGLSYVVRDDGQVTRHAESVPLAFPAIVPGDPVRAPRAIATGVQSRAVYILEPGRDRIVALAKDGEALRQYRYRRPSQAAEPHLLAQDEQRGWFVLADTERVFLALFPRW